MRKFFFIIAIILCATAKSQNLANMLEDEKFWNEETLDAAYIAPSTTLYTTWYHNREGDSFVIRPNGTILFTIPTEIGGVHVKINVNGTWSRNKGTFTAIQNFATMTVVPDNEEMAKLSVRKQDEIKALINQAKRQGVNKGKETMTFVLVRLDKDYLIFGTKTEYGMATNGVYYSEKKKKELEGPKVEQVEVKQPEVKQAEVDPEMILDAPEESADFPGDVYAWLSKNIIYPPACSEKGISGRVSVQFVIEKDGSLSNIKVLRSPDEHLSEEAIRLVKTMPKWNPAKQGEKPVRMRYVLPVMFRLS